jgi:hypothetical protein
MHKYHNWWSSSSGHMNERSFRHFNTKGYLEKMKRLLKSHIWLHHIEDLFEMIEMDTWITKFGVRTESYASGKITDTALPSWPDLHIPKTSPTDHHALGDSPMDPQTLGRPAQSEAKAERPHMLPQMGSRSGHSKMGWSCKVGPAPTCKETQRGSMLTIGWWKCI